MSIAVRSQDGVRQVAVLGRLDDGAEQEQLHALLAMPGEGAGAGSDAGGGAGAGGAARPGAGGPDDGGAVELSFYDADQLPRATIAALAARLDAGGRLKIVVYRALLAHSLLRLGLPLRQVASQPPRAPAAPCRALALAGSARSLDKMLHIVEALPRSDLALFVLQHVDERQANLLDQLLKSRTDYEVLMPQHLTAVRPGTLYVAPPGHHMKVAHGLVYLTRDRKIEFTRPAIDALFTSLAAEYGGAVLALLLCGYGRDGVAGCAALRAAGSVVVVEDGADCAEARAMPDAARDAGHYDHVLGLAAIASLAAATAAGPEAAPAGALLERFLEALAGQGGHDFRHYQRDSLQRRVEGQVRASGAAGFAAYQRALWADPGLLERLVAELPVGVTSFFRHPEQFLLLRQQILPYLASFPAIRLWSAGCASGEEAYSLAIVLDELGLLERSHLFATDLNPHLLALAQSGLYPAAALDGSRDRYLASGGARRFDLHVVPQGRYLAVAERLRERVLFHRHSLSGEGSFNEFQLILCRNVLIYFDRELQRQVLRRFAGSLHADGFLVLGPQDGLGLAAREAGFVPFQPGGHIYRRGERAA